MTLFLARLCRPRSLVLGTLLVLSGVLGAGCGSSSATRQAGSETAATTGSTSPSSQQATPQETESPERTASAPDSVKVLRPSKVRNRLENAADDWYGTSYEWGGDSKDGVDCSGLVQHLYKDAFDYSLPRVTETQLQAGPSVERDQIRPGDLVFFQPEGEYNHVGVYLGEGTFVHASSSNGVTDSQMDNNYWDQYYWTARRPLRPSKVPDGLESELLAYKQPASNSTVQTQEETDPTRNDEAPSDTSDTTSENTQIASCETASVDCTEASNASTDASASDDTRKGW